MAADRLLNRFIKSAAPLLASTRGRLILAVSGGSDSLALLHLTARSGLFQPENLRVACFDHRLRAESAAEVTWVADQARGLGVGFTTGSWVDPQGRGNLEARARRARYDFLIEAARAFGAEAVAVGHQRDDLAETLLGRLLRGSGLPGLAGMAPRRPLAEGIELVRLLLPFRRSALRLWLSDQEIAWLEDSSNQDATRLRARLRHRTLPALTAVEGRDHGDPAERLAGAAEQLREAREALDWALDRAMAGLELRQTAPGEMSLSHAGLAALPDALVKGALTRFHARLTGSDYPPGARALDGFLFLVRSKRRRWRMRMRGLTVRRGEGTIFLGRL